MRLLELESNVMRREGCDEIEELSSAVHVI
jgi:hypothetical protein